MHLVVNCICLVILVRNVGCVSYSLNISPDDHVNEVDERFLSFTVDPGLLFTKTDDDMRKDLICMSTALSPAYLRLSGASTAYMSFYNFTVTINNPAADGVAGTVPGQSNRQGDLVNPGSGHLDQFFIITHTQWLQFAHWAQSTGFTLVFGLNNRERTDHGLWDPNIALSILTIADYANLSNIYWELGHKCHNQSVDEYLADTETLRVIVETFPNTLGWRVVSGDVTDCVHTTKEFRDYYSLVTETADAIFMNGQKSAHYLSLMSEEDRFNLLRLLSFSPRPLWLLEPAEERGEMERAADWLTSLGHAAKNGFRLHYREVRADELYKPTLSFYMALLYKNLVGSRVIDVEATKDAGSAVFAHCTTLRHKVIPGAVTIYGVNMGEEAARVTLRWTRRERGGDVMRFILTRNLHRNIVVNGKEMQNEGDILPIVKRVRPYKSLILNLPPKSFGFWVLANTDIKACQDFETHGDSNNSTKNSSDVPLKHKKIKRSVVVENDYTDVGDAESSEAKPDSYIASLNIPALQERIDAINNKLKTLYVSSKSNADVNATNLKHQRNKRQLNTNKKLKTEQNKKKKRRPILRNIIEKVKNIHEELKTRIHLPLHSKRNPIEILQNEKGKKITARRHKYSDLFVKPETPVDYEYENRNKLTRTKRSIDEPNPMRSPRYIFSKNRRDDYSTENEKIETTKKIQDYGMKYLEYFDQSEDDNSTEFTVIDTIENISEEADTPVEGLVNNSIWKLITAAVETNSIINRFWQMFT